MISVRFYGVRGSYPVPGAQVLRYGGHTSCVVLRESYDGVMGNPLILDLGSGAIALGQELVKDGPVVGTALLSHLHWDHVQGLPFFSPLEDSESSLEIRVPGAYRPVEDRVRGLLGPPAFPVPLQQRPATVRVVEMGEELYLQDPKCRILALSVSHTDPVLGYRVEMARSTVTYITDHQAPQDRETIPENIRRLCEGADLLIHDAQYTDEEFERKAHWGHSTYGYAVHVAESCNVARVAFYHHDPSRIDDDLDAIVEGVRAADPRVGFMAAREGMDILLP